MELVDKSKAKSDFNGVTPNPDIEYVVFMDTWLFHKQPDQEFGIGSYEKYPVNKGTIVINVHQVLDDSGYRYTVKDTGRIGHTHYPWSLVENTKENQEYMNWIDELREKQSEIQKGIELAFTRLTSLKGR